MKVGTKGKQMKTRWLLARKDKGRQQKAVQLTPRNSREQRTSSRNEA